MHVRTHTHTHTHTHINSTPLWILQVLPEDQKAVEFFTYFQIIKSAQNQEHITNSTQTLGLYVDTQDGWKVKMTNNNSLWDKFCIEGFTHPTHPFPPRACSAYPMKPTN